MRYLTLGEVLTLHRRLLDTSRGPHGLRDLRALESAVAQPRMSYAGVDLYPDLPTKAGALGFSLIQNHPFVDGNKRVAHAAMETFLMLNGYELTSSVEEAEQIIMGVAGGGLGREQLVGWIVRTARPVG